MATGDLSLGIPGAGASDFATTPIPSLVLNRWTAEAGAPTRGIISEQRISIAARSNHGNAQIIGPAYGPKFIWPVAAMMTRDQARQLGALAHWQDDTYKGNSDGALRLVDEIDYTEAEPTPHSRTLLSAIAESWNASYVFGYPVCPVLLVLPEDWRQQIGKWSSGSEARLCTFTALEV